MSEIALRQVVGDPLRVALACARLTPTERDLVTLTSAFADEGQARPTLAFLDWHGLLALAAHHLAGATTRAPAAVSEALRVRRRETSASNLFRTRELERILAALSGAAIAALPLKGPALATAALGDVTLRQFSDLDVLVSEGDFRRALELAIARGFVLDPAFRLSAAETNLYLRHGYHVPLRHGENGTVLELHWQLAPATSCVPIRFEEFWERRTQVALHERTVAALSAEDHMLVLAISNSKEMWDRVCRTTDVAELARRNAHFDWDACLRRAHAIGAERMLLLAAHLAATHLEAPIPDEVKSRAERDGSVRSLAHRVSKTWREQVSCDEARAASHRFFVRALDGAMRRARHIVRVFFQPSLNDVRVFHLPDRLFFLAWILRPLRLVFALVQHAVDHHPPRRAPGPEMQISWAGVQTAAQPPKRDL